MNFSVHLHDRTVERLNQIARERGKTRNALIREAIEDWLSRDRPGQWPPALMQFQGIRELPRFEAERQQLRPPRRLRLE